MRTHLLATAVATAFAAGALAPAALRAQDAEPKKKNLEVSGTAGFTQTSGNANATTTNFGNKVKYTARGWILAEDLAFFYGEAENKVNANFWNGGLRAERRIMERIGLFVAGRFDRNVLQGIASRFEEGFGVDVKAIVAKRDQLSFQVGGSLFQQNLTPGSTATAKRNFPAARLGLDYKHNFTELAYFQQTGEYLPNLSDSDAYLMNSESSLVAPLSRRLGLKLSYVVRYNNSPPIREEMRLKTTDTFFSSGITVSF
ncbi:MAG TPA: DUF481 domain-containing protein [Gemmatimonas sp.]|uniref:DUF481 domain-containing protein n=1 Tax=Gemmatimonas sp. TaxID=1962908 RepID=UPI002ED84F67